MKTSLQSNQPSPSRGAWLLTLVFALVAILALIAHWIAVQKQESAGRLIELQTIEIESLRTALEMEGLVSTESLRQLRGIAAGRSISAHAKIHLADPPSANTMISAFWSDELSAGFIALPADHELEDEVQIDVLLKGVTAESLIETTRFETKSNRVIGFAQPADFAVPDQLIIRISGTASDPSPRQFEVDWVR